MNRFAQSFVIASVLALPLAGCSSMPDFSGDPTDWFNVDFLNNKKPLPGVRKPVFPEGVPGVTQGVPPDLMKGNQPEAGLAQEQGQANASAQSASLQSPEPAAAVDQAAAVEEEPAPPPKPKAKPKPKPRPKVAARPAPVAQPEAADRTPTPVTVRRTDSQQWPDPPAAQQAQPPQQAGGTQWPPAPAAQGGAPAGVQWPDPPASH